MGQKILAWCSSKGAICQIDDRHFYLGLLQNVEAIVAQIHAEERSHCRQLLAEAKGGSAAKKG